MLAFKAILDDIPGQPRGIMVAKNGFQEGAKTFAAAQGIDLYELREPDDRNMRDRIKRIVLNIRFSEPKYENATPIPDQEWVSKECQRVGITKDEKFNVRGDARRYIRTDSSGNSLGTLQDVFRKHLPPPSEAGREQKEYTFTEETFLNLPEGLPLSRVKLSSIRADIVVTSFTHQETIESDDLIELVLERIGDGRTLFVTRDGEISDPDQTTLNSK